MVRLTASVTTIVGLLFTHLAAPGGVRASPYPADPSPVVVVTTTTSNSIAPVSTLYAVSHPPRAGGDQVLANPTVVASAPAAPTAPAAPAVPVTSAAPVTSNVSPAPAPATTVAAPAGPPALDTAPAPGITNAGNTAVTCWSKTYTLTKEELSKDFKFSCPNHVTFNNGAMQWRLDDQCAGAGLEYGRNDIWYGRASITMKVGANSGAVTAFIRGVPEHDEIDFEWVGKNTKDTLTMYFVDGKRVNGDDLGEHTQLSKTDFATTFVEYAIDFTATQVQWLMNGKVIRTLKNDPKKKYPTNARAWIMNIWNGGATSPGWAGKTDWSKGPSTVEVKNLSYQSYC
ncbi:transglycosylase [Tieghemiomyces parasiticus]|uniref:Transglycosylase n=1 Tax=Tieghemiomyces parasiticus TaxID=78921 RepID=A0A9W8AAM5_9FUNG|nr:transglycosylase [Tieghemiomyces parasiticus]